MDIKHARMEYSKMPNDCWNRITIKATNAQIRDILLHEFVHLPAWKFELVRVGNSALIVKIISAWDPDREFISKLFDTYDGIWIKNVWSEEGGNAGIIVGNKESFQELLYDEGCIEEWHHRFIEDDTMPDPTLLDN